MNKGTGMLYVADTGGGRVLWVNTQDPNVTISEKWETILVEARQSALERSN